MALIVLINGIGHETTPMESQRASQARALSHEFPGAKILVFDSVGEREHDSRARNFMLQALEITGRVHSDAADKQVDNTGMQRPIIFIAWDIGAALVKQILLIALEDPRYHWIILQTVSLHLVESPSHTTSESWRQFLSQRLSVDRLCTLNIASYIDVLPKTLANLEIQFSVLSKSFDQKTYNQPAASVELPGLVSWDFHGQMGEEIVIDVRTSLKSNQTRFKKKCSLLQGVPAIPDLALGRLTLVAPSSSLMAYTASHSSVESWLRTPGSSVLAVCGPPDSGYTYVASHIVFSLLLSRPTPENLFLSFSFSRGDKFRDSEFALVTSLIRQLLTLMPQSYSRALYVLETLSKNPTLSSRLLWVLLHHLLGTLTETCIFLSVDSVDQCREEIVTRLSSLAASTPLKLLVTTSGSLEMKSTIAYDTVSLEDDSWKSYIRTMAVDRVSRILTTRPVWMGLEQSIIEKLCTGKHSSYTSTAWNLEYLEQGYIPSTRLALRDYLSTPMVPAEMLKASFNGQQECIATQSKLALNWIFHAVRPLTISELAVALTLGPGPQDIERPAKLVFEEIVENVSWDLVRDLDNSLGLCIKTINGRVMLADGTLRRHLEAHTDLIIPGFHGYIANQCLEYVSVSSKQACNTRLDQDVDASASVSVHIARAFRDYAIIYWADHYNLQTQFSSSLDQTVIEYFSALSDRSADTSDLESWVRRCGLTIGQKEDTMKHPLHLAARIGFDRIVRNLLSFSEQNTPDNIEKAIEIAASAGNLKVLQELHHHAQPADLVQAACAAAEHGHCPVIQRVLADMNPSDVETLISDEGDSSLLLRAISNGHLEATELLLARGFGLRAVDSSGNTAVHLASRLGDIDILRTLRSASPGDFKWALGLANLEGMYPLHLTCRAGFIDAFRLVVHESPKDLVQKHNTALQTPVHIAAESGHLLILQSLSTGTTTLGTMTGSPSPLILAACNGHQTVTGYLIKGKNTVEIEDGERDLDMAFSGAISNGHFAVVELLIPYVDVNPEYLTLAAQAGRLDVFKALIKAIPSSDDPTAIHGVLLAEAIHNDYVDIVRYLVREVVKPPWVMAEDFLHVTARLGREFCLRELLQMASPDAIRRRDSRSRTPLEVAAASGNFATIKLLLEWEKRHATSDASTPRRSAKALMLLLKLHDAPMRLDLVRYLLENGWSADSSSGSRTTPLHLAVQSHGDDDLGLVMLLLEKGANPNACDEDGEAPLHNAARAGYARVARLLLKGNADPDTVSSDGVTALHIAAKHGHDAVVRVLLGLPDIQDETRITPTYKIANIEIKAPGDWRAIHLAVSNSRDVTATLIGANPKPNLDARLAGTQATPLILAAEKKDVETCALLLAAGADANAIGGAYGSALHAAAFNYDYKLAQLLLSRGADTNSKRAPFGTSLHVVCTGNNESTKRLNLVKLLIKHQARVNEPNEELRTPIMNAIHFGLREIVHLLLDSGADIHVLDATGSSALHFATRLSDHTLTRQLIAAGADPNLLDGCGRGALYLTALYMGNNVTAFYDILAALPEENSTAYFSAAMPALFKSVDEKLITTILHRREGLNPNITDSSGWTSLDLARLYNMSSTIIHSLQTLGARDGTEKTEPQKLSLNDRSEVLRVLFDGRYAEVKEEFSTMHWEIFGLVRTDYCVPIDGSIFYYEVEVIECGEENVISVGLAQEGTPISTMVGWWPGSWGYFSDSGILRDAYRSKVATGLVYGAGQVVGLAYDTSTKRLWFTVNGDRSPGHFENVTGQVYPAVSLLTTTEPDTKGPAKVRVTLPSMVRAGLQQFKYNNYGTEPCYE
ncbi:ankyrin repeat-containing domain protein [Nemania sp. NC0429]|nr:ankyrin repeat-containing domain protein [Nemania sp. NC0429]